MPCGAVTTIEMAGGELVGPARVSGAVLTNYPVLINVHIVTGRYISRFNVIIFRRNGPSHPVTDDLDRLKA